MIDLLALLPLIEFVPAASIELSTPATEDFSVLLTELIGNTELIEDTEPEAVPLPVEGNGRKKAQNAQIDLTSCVSCAFLWPSPFTGSTAEPQPDNALIVELRPALEGEPQPMPPKQPVVAGAIPQPILEDVKKLEITVQYEALKPAEVQESTESSGEAVITTDPIANIRQPALPFRVIAVQRVSCEANDANTQDPDKAPATAQSSDSPAAAPPHLFENPARAVEAVEQPLPAQPIEVRDVPKLQIVRTVSMEVGEADSQIVVRIEDRAGGMNLHFGTENENMQHALETSMSSLVNALKREKIEITTVEVSRKSPIEKIRRMKEAY